MKIPWQTRPQCQMVIELPAGEAANLDHVAECELNLARLLRTGEVDLREVGGDVVGLYILTSEPEACLHETLGHLAAMQVKPVAAGLRSAEGQEFVRLWPQPAVG